MKEIVGVDIFSQIADVDCLCINTNCSLIQDDDGLTINPMGAMAGVAASFWPDVPFIYGKLLQCIPDVPCILGWINKRNRGDFISIFHGYEEGSYTALVAYPTMKSIGVPASLELVVRSAELLVELTNLSGWNTVILGRMGAGVGGLNYEKQVRPAVENILDDRFTVYHK